MTPAASGDLPRGFLYRAEFLSEDEERQVLDEIERLTFGEVRMHGVAARRRVAHFGWRYGYESWRIEPGPPIPEVLLPMRSRAAGLLGVASDALAEALVTEYTPGAGIGWHRDAPAFGDVVGVSLGGACRLRLAKGDGAEREVRDLALAPRSAYVLSGPARTVWRHSIPPTKVLRYSVTFRTLRRHREASARRGSDAAAGDERR